MHRDPHRPMAGVLERRHAHPAPTARAVLLEVLDPAAPDTGLAYCTDDVGGYLLGHAVSRCVHNRDRLVFELAQLVSKYLRERAVRVHDHRVINTNQDHATTHVLGDRRRQRDLGVGFGVDGVDVVLR
jgi:hypothetical protein